MSARALRALFAAAACCAFDVAACPVDTAPRDDGVLLTLQSADGRVAGWDAARLRALTVSTWNETRRVAAEGGAGAEEQQSISYDGVRLRDLLAAGAAGDPAHDRNLRDAVIEAVATDGYRAVFSWGELFNAAAGERTIVVLASNGRPLDARAGPPALRALADTGPARGMCATCAR